MIIKKYDIISSIFWLCIGFGFVIGGIKLHFGSWSSPKPGFFPIIIGVVLCLLSILLITLTCIKKGKTKAYYFWKTKNSWIKIIETLFSLIFFVFALDRLGYFISTVIFLFLLIKVVGGIVWVKALIVSCITSLVTYIIFGVMMEVPFPTGIIMNLLQH